MRELDRQGVTGVCTRCPVCERPGKFSVNFRDGLALFCCHRATCGVRGVYAIAGDGISREARKAAAFTPRPLTAPFRVPQAGDYWWDYVWSRMGAPASNRVDHWCLESGFRVLSDVPDTCVWEIENLRRRVLGHVTRTKEKRVMSWYVSDAPRYGYWGPSGALNSILIVEDPMSAALFPGPAIALLGTNLSREVVAELSLEAPKAKYYVALDPDATAQAGRVVERLRAGGLEALVILIDRDVKDMSVEQRSTLFQYVRSAT